MIFFSWWFKSWYCESIQIISFQKSYFMFWMNLFIIYMGESNHDWEVLLCVINKAIHNMCESIVIRIPQKKKLLFESLKKKIVIRTTIHHDHLLLMLNRFNLHVNKIHLHMKPYFIFKHLNQITSYFELIQGEVLYFFSSFNLF